MPDETTKADEYDRAHGDPTKGRGGVPAMTEEQEWGGNLNPVRNPAPPMKDLKKVGGV